MQQVGVVKEIWRYPVKGMAGEQLECCSIGEIGVFGDRIWALRDTQRQEVQSCKFRPELLQCTAILMKDGSVSITMPHGDALSSDDTSLNDRLSSLVGHDSTLERLKPLYDDGENLAFYRRYKVKGETWLDELKATFTREPGEPLPDFSQMPQQVQDFVTIPGTFFLVSPLHFITTASIQSMQQKLPEADWDVRRFRPNIVIETHKGYQGLVEQAWIGRQLTIAGLNIPCTAAAPRCGAITRAQNALAFDASMLRTVVRDADQNLGIYGSTQEEGELRVGDAVYLQ
ncbi:MOSC domain-containing protein [Gilvimarinus agarilyticus]|uniref:MOSC domain-containing protein n=1 Tax=Gilvimarinus sp. 2_MG-2023 TaxID=3062666 RepID=UPI001C0A45D6|nr:MOSC domain-containing protein [Gilvimarinus sp. 2_MG-2023]MBU2887109.1 MOSC domain-containing protein [Gilvimarinus agarilyticus]MDO6571768.1 MOSC domain-containing protein [Gilvimarinus sp. 2_MG-2023]